jgi:GntR family transcriptional regulator
MEIDKGAIGWTFAFRLDHASGVPPYLQLVQQVEDALRLGYLTAGDQLPRVKDVVASLAINPNTVLKAYRELEQKGLVSGRPGLGTFVQPGVRTVALADRSALRRKLQLWLSEALDAGLDDESIRALFTRSLYDLRSHRSAGEAS